MKQITWDQLINNTNDKQTIKLIGYGSLLNENTHHEKHKYKTVVFYGFKRIYNLKVIYNTSSKDYINFYKKYLIKYGITTNKEIEKLMKSNICALNCIVTGNNQDKVNGLCIEINKEDIYDYSMREKQYKLVETTLDYICPKTGKITLSDDIAYVLTAKEESIINNGIPFEQYHINTRNGAYNFGEYFGKMFDETTFTVEGDLLIN